MDKKQYNNIIDWTLNNEEQAQCEDSLTVARAVCTNLGVALPQGNLSQVAEVLATNDYMGWKACTKEEAQASADVGTPAISVSNDRIVVLAATDEEQPMAATATVMTLADGTGVVGDSVAYYSYSGGTTTYRSWQHYANRIMAYASGCLDMNSEELEEQNAFPLTDGLWCVDFVRLCCKLAGVYDIDYDDIIPTTSSSTAMRNWFRSNYESRFYDVSEDGIDKIQPGDIAFIENANDSSTAEHTCIVMEGVNSQGKVNTINGNWGGTVKMQKFPYTDSETGKIKEIKWYAHPDYEKANGR